jgi:DNA modification methylase
MNKLFYGDNLDILRDQKKIKEESVDLCYIDPPFNSKRNYNQIYNNVGGEDRAQAQAFTDTWTWDDLANVGYPEILANDKGRFQKQLVELIKGLHGVLGEGSLLAYLVSMSLRITEIHRVLKRTGSFYLHCDPTASHYLKLVCDAVFCSQGGTFVNELIWCYSIGGKSKKAFGKKHDVILYYAKTTGEHIFNESDASIPRKLNSHMRVVVDEQGEEVQEKTDRKTGKIYRYPLSKGKIAEDYWTDIETLNREDKERLHYPTQKPEELLERIIKVSSHEGDLVMDAYCGCGTTIAVAQRLKRGWIGIDITYASISLVLKRLEDTFGAAALRAVTTDGIPRDMDSARALAHKKDDRLRKEFEKWAVLTYTNNRATINDKKGADAGIDGIGYFLTAKNDNTKIIFQVKSGGVARGDIATLRGDMGRENAALAVLITLEEPSGPMVKESKAAGQYRHEVMGRSYDRIGIVTAQELIDGKRLDLPMSVEVVAAAKRAVEDKQIELDLK